MPFIRGQVLSGTTDRTCHIQVPATPPQATVPAIVVFHGGGQDVAEIARRWGVDPPNPVPTPLENYLLVFPEADRRLSDEWVHFQSGDSGFPTSSTPLGSPTAGGWCGTSVAMSSRPDRLRLPTDGRRTAAPSRLRRHDEQA